MSDTTQGYISLAEAADHSEYSQEYLSLRARQGKLKAVKQGRNWVTTMAWLNEYLNQAEDAKRQLREATVVTEAPKPQSTAVASEPKSSLEESHLFEHHPAATGSLKKAVAIPVLSGTAVKTAKKDEASSGSRLLWTESQPAKTSFFEEVSDEPTAAFDWAEQRQEPRVVWQPSTTHHKQHDPAATSLSAVASATHTPLTEELSDKASDHAEPFWHADNTPAADMSHEDEVPVAVEPETTETEAIEVTHETVTASSVPATTKQVNNRFSLDGIFASLPRLATAVAAVGALFLLTLSIAQFGIGKVAETIAVGGMVLIGNEPTLQWEAGSYEPKVVWGGEASLPAHALSAQQGQVAGASVDRSESNEHYSMAQMIAAGLLVVSDSLNPDQDQYNNFSSWLIETYNLPAY